MKKLIDIKSKINKLKKSDCNCSHSFLCAKFINISK